MGSFLRGWGDLFKRASFEFLGIQCCLWVLSAYLMAKHLVSFQLSGPCRICASHSKFWQQYWVLSVRSHAEEGHEVPREAEHSMAKPQAGQSQSLQEAFCYEDIGDEEIFTQESSLCKAWEKNREKPPTSSTMGAQCSQDPLLQWPLSCPVVAAREDTPKHVQHNVSKMWHWNFGQGTVPKRPRSMDLPLQFAHMQWEDPCRRLSSNLRCRCWQFQDSSQHTSWSVVLCSCRGPSQFSTPSSGC